ncbi:putative secreted hydrolase [Variovorax sp. TBS-050B]|uniref:lipocalin-like domain-containing protein n=1 Tax=Variovorax sp. TBS-050B TaxID=2940551 RepID=UPI002473126D|nr:carotenoid 1,2-hydratase [Variovorax sp. TBS-050B]MDH6593744.1 putative secreted hydrolase [Variovorax sp. TBS-050B]
MAAAPAIAAGLLSRRSLLLAALAAAPAARALPARALQFPRDFGSHPEMQTEWWYVTGHGRTRAGREFGFQVTFFRSRVQATQALRSAFAAKHLVFAHAAVTDLQARVLHHDQRIARAGFGVAAASEADTDVRLRDWSLVRKNGRYAARVPAGEFTLDLHFTPTQPVLLQGKAGLSRKGPEEAQASYYYSEPQLRTQGRLVLGKAREVFELEGSAWLDHEWSEALLHPEAVGWDWIGMNLDDGSALTAFHLRRRDGSALWAGGSFRTRDGVLRTFGHDEVRFEAGAPWTSPRTQARYPTQWRVHTPAGAFEVRALLDDQELDSRGSTGGVYWEGLSELRDAAGRRVGRGYLEMTGYAAPLRL